MPTRARPPCDGRTRRCLRRRRRRRRFDAVRSHTPSRLVGMMIYLGYLQRALRRNDDDDDDGSERCRCTAPCKTHHHRRRKTPANPSHARTHARMRHTIRRSEPAHLLCAAQTSAVARSVLPRTLDWVLDEKCLCTQINCRPTLACVLRSANKSIYNRSKSYATQLGARE